MFTNDSETDRNCKESLSPLPGRAEKLDSQFESTLKTVLGWAAEHRSDHDPLLVYTSAAPDEIASNQKTLGVDHAGFLCEAFLASVASKFVDDGIFQLIVAGGETSGAIVTKLGLDLLRIGPEIDPGRALDFGYQAAAGEIALALKSGNFGSEEFFVNAWRLLGSSEHEHRTKTSGTHR